jgi:hypothetical protein
LPTLFEDYVSAEMRGRTESMYGVRPAPIYENPPHSCGDLVTPGGTKVDRPKGRSLEDTEPGGLEEQRRDVSESQHEAFTAGPLKFYRLDDAGFGLATPSGGSGFRPEPTV